MNVTTFKELNENQLKEIVDFILDLDSKLNLYDLEYNKLENAYLNQILETQSDDQKKHIKQISSIVTHLDVLLNNIKANDEKNEDSTLLCEVCVHEFSFLYKVSFCMTNFFIKIKNLYQNPNFFFS